MAGGECAQSEAVWEEACRLGSACYVGASRCGWLVSQPQPVGPGLVASDAMRQAARDVCVGWLVLCAELFCRHRHVSCLACLADVLADATDRVAGVAGTAPLSGGQMLAVQDARVAAALSAALSTAASLVAKSAADGSAEGEEVLLPALRLATSLLRASPALLCAGESAIEALWSLAVSPFGPDGAAVDAECRDAGMTLLQTLIEAACGPTVAGSGGAPAQHVERPPDLATAAVILGALRPRVPSLIWAMMSAVAHAAPATEVERASTLLHATAATFPGEWSATVPQTVERLATDLKQRRRNLPSEAQRLLVRGALKQPLLPVTSFVAMWVDLAQVARMGTSARALDRYAR